MTHEDVRLSSQIERNSFPATQLALLALVRLAEPIALSSIFPYAYDLVLDFGFSEQNAAFYAGLVIAAFSFAESFSGIICGAASDKVGRKPLLLAGCLGTMVSLMIVGTAQNFWMALVGRLLGGLLNGNQGVIQTMVGELVTDPRHEPRAYSIMPFVWSVGSILGPGIGGMLAVPSRTFPETFPADGIWGRFPYLLPNVVCAAILLVAVVLGYFFIKETHPDFQQPSHSRRRVSSVDVPHEQSHLMPTSGATEHAPSDIQRNMYGTFNQVNVPEQEIWDVYAGGKEAYQRPKVLTKQVVMLIAALGAFTFISMCYDHLIPIFLQYPRSRPASVFSLPDAFAGGLGISTQEVGLIMSANGVIAMAIQAVVFPIITSALGVWKTFLIVTVGHPLAYVIVPFLTVVPDSFMTVGIYLSFTLRNVFSILAYPLLLILVKEACPSSNMLGKINGLAASVAAACRCMAPPIAGLLWGIGAKIDFVPLAWWSAAMIGVLAAVQALMIRRPPNTATVHSFAHDGARDPDAKVPHNTVLVRFHDESGDDYSSDEDLEPERRRLLTA